MTSGVCICQSWYMSALAVYDPTVKGTVNGWWPQGLTNNQLLARNVRVYKCVAAAVAQKYRDNKERSQEFMAPRSAKTAYYEAFNYARALVTGTVDTIPQVAVLLNASFILDQIIEIIATAMRAVSGEEEEGLKTTMNAVHKLQGFITTKDISIEHCNKALRAVLGRYRHMDMEIDTFRVCVRIGLSGLEHPLPQPEQAAAHAQASREHTAAYACLATLARIKVQAQDSHAPAPLHPLRDYTDAHATASRLITCFARNLPAALCGVDPRQWDGQAAAMHRLIKAMARLEGLRALDQMIRAPHTPNCPRRVRLALAASALCGVDPEALFPRPPVVTEGTPPPDPNTTPLRKLTADLLSPHVFTGDRIVSVLIIADILLSRMLRVVFAANTFAEVLATFSPWVDCTLTIICMSPPVPPQAAPGVSEQEDRDNRWGIMRDYRRTHDVAAKLYEALLDANVPGAATQGNCTRLFRFISAMLGPTERVMEIFQHAAGKLSPGDSLALSKTLLPALADPQLSTHRRATLQAALAALVPNLAGTPLDMDLRHQLVMLVSGKNGALLTWSKSSVLWAGWSEVWASAITLTLAINTALGASQRLVANTLIELLDHCQPSIPLTHAMPAGIFQGMRTLLAANAPQAPNLAAALVAFAQRLSDDNMKLLDGNNVSNVLLYAADCRRCLRMLLRADRHYQMASPNGTILAAADCAVIESVLTKLSQVEGRPEADDDEDEDEGGAGDGMEEDDDYDDDDDVDI